MPNQKQPIDLLEWKGKKHLTKEEIAARHNSEIVVPADNIAPPAYLNRDEKAEFAELAPQLVECGIMSNLDVGELARYCKAHGLYKRFTKRLEKGPKKMAKAMRREAEALGKPISEDKPDELLTVEYETAMAKLQSKYFEQCEVCARNLGLTITSRCRLVIPKAPEARPENKFKRFAQDA